MSEEEILLSHSPLQVCFTFRLSQTYHFSILSYWSYHSVEHPTELSCGWASHLNGHWAVHWKQCSNMEFWLFALPVKPLTEAVRLQWGKNAVPYLASYETYSKQKDKFLKDISKPHSSYTISHQTLEDFFDKCNPSQFSVMSSSGSNILALPPTFSVLCPRCFSLKSSWASPAVGWVIPACYIPGAFLKYLLGGLSLFRGLSCLNMQRIPELSVILWYLIQLWPILSSQILTSYSVSSQKMLVLLYFWGKCLPPMAAPQCETWPLT